MRIGSRLKTAGSVASALLLLASTARAAEVTYYFGVSPQRTNVTFESQADFENILGSTNTLSGTAKIDMDGGRGSLSLEVPVASLKTGIDSRDGHLRSPMWLDADQYPSITFSADQVKKLDENNWEASGAFTAHGKSKDMTVVADVRPIPAGAAKAAGLEAGDWVKVTATFSVNLSDFGVKVPDQLAGKVSDMWSVKVIAFASTVGPGGGM
jgi:polyisoprenoid-binding protein YceI